MTNLILNGSFEDRPWTDVITGYGNLVNQQPYGWTLNWLLPGQESWAINQKEGTKPIINSVPECLHKLASQLPSDEQPGAPNALILDGITSYKMFAQNGIWAAELVQVRVTDPNTPIKLTVPIQIHYHQPVGADSPDDVEVWLTVNGNTVKFFANPDLPDHQWVYLTVEATSDSIGQVGVQLRAMTKWTNSRDVFIDALKLEVIEGPVPPPDPPPPPTAGAPWMKHNGFHTGGWSYTDGIGEWLQRMVNAGLPFTAKTVRGTASLMDAQPLIQNGATGYAIWRLDEIAPKDNDVPNYGVDVVTEANRYWQAVLNTFPPELDKNIVWVELINEPDKNWSSWLGQLGYQIGLLALRDGYKLLCFGWSGGEPEPEDWLTPGMEQYLNLCAQHPNQIGVSVHEYQFDINKTLLEGYPYLIGRYLNIHTACDQFGIAYPTIFITEIGWAYNDIPPIDDALQQMVAVKDIYAPGNVKGSAIWALDYGAAWGDIQQQVHRLMWQDNQVGTTSPLLNTIKNNPIDVPEPPIEKHQAIVVKVPQEATQNEWLQLVDYSYQFKHTMTASHDDALYILGSGNSDSYAKVYQPEQSSQQQFISLLEAQGINWVELVL